jgi:hypothetical protein
LAGSTTEAGLGAEDTLLELEAKLFCGGVPEEVSSVDVSAFSAADVITFFLDNLETDFLKDRGRVLFSFSLSFSSIPGESSEESELPPLSIYDKKTIN